MLIWGRLIFLTITALPETPVQTSGVLIFCAAKSRWIASMTAPESMMAPSTMASGGSGSMPMFVSWYSAPPLPPALSSTALMAEDPMSRPTRPFFLPNKPTGASPGLPTALASDRSVCPLAATPEFRNRDEIRSYERELKCYVKLAKPDNDVKEKFRGLRLSERQHRSPLLMVPPKKGTTFPRTGF